MESQKQAVEVYSNERSAGRSRRWYNIKKYLLVQMWKENWQAKNFECRMQDGRISSGCHIRFIEIPAMVPKLLRNTIQV